MPKGYVTCQQGAGKHASRLYVQHAVWTTGMRAETAACTVQRVDQGGHLAAGKPQQAMIHSEMYARQCKVT